MSTAESMLPCVLNLRAAWRGTVDAQERSVGMDEAFRQRLKASSDELASLIRAVECRMVDLGLVEAPPAAADGREGKNQKDFS